MSAGNMNKRSVSQTKRAIMEAALNLFVKHGFTRTTMRMIAKEANISVGALYLHFKNKEALCLFILREKLGELFRKLEDVTRNKTKAEEKLKAFMGTCIEYAKDNRELIVAHSAEKGFTFGLEIKKEYSAKQRGLIKEIVLEGIRTGEFKEIDVEGVANTVMALIRGFVLSLVIDEECNLKEKDYFLPLFYGLKKG
ncbi:MAG: TetR/AcrR family transcriptional regulator [Deltaproteobacteria bacterium]|nr:TetR/AcrR family transcriptional regulator [Deltaproteobacteria bacterium]